MSRPLPFAKSAGSAAVLLALCATAADASSHREAPFVTQFPKVDAPDFYLFNSYEDGRGDHVTLIANYLPLQDAYGGPNYFTLDSSALYEIHIDNTGDAVEDLTFQFRFSEESPGAGLPIGADGESVAVPLKAIGPITDGESANANFSESYELAMVSGDRRSGQRSAVTGTGSDGASFAKPLDYAGTKTFPDYTAYVNSLSNSGMGYNDVTFAGCPEGQQDGRVFVGQRKDPFAINLGRIFDLVNLDPLAAGPGDAGADDLADKNVTTLAIEVRKGCLTGGGDNTVVGAWTTASKRQVSVLDPDPELGGGAVEGGAWTQLSRLGSPLVNEVVIGLPDKDRFNASEPMNDTQFAQYVFTPTLPVLLDVLFNGDGALNPDGSIAPSNAPRGDLVAAFLTGVEGVNQLPTVTPSEMLRLNTAIAATPMGEQVNLGVAGGDLAGFPNGRRPGDDVTDIALRAVLGAFCHPIPVDLDEDGTPGGEGDNLLLCGDTPEAAASAAPAGTAAVNDGVPQNADMFDAAFPYLTTPIPGASM